jgi:hypothetical protein
MRHASDLFSEALHQARFADPGLAYDQRHLAFTFDGRFPSIHQQTQFVFAPDERSQSSRRRAMVGEVAAKKALSEETIATVLERTGGVPLFVEELTRVVLESSNAKLTEREIPVTLHDSLMARLDRLGSAKEVAQVGAVIGGDFSYELLHAVHPLDEADLQELCDSLTPN